MTPDLAHAIERTLRAGTRGILLVTPEEGRGLSLLEAVGERLSLPVHTWSVAEGVDGDRLPVKLGELLGGLAQSRDDGIWVLLDALPQLTDPVARRRLRALAQRTRGPVVVVIDPLGYSGDPAITERIPELWTATLPPPSRVELEQGLIEIASALESEEHPGAEEAIGEAAGRLAAAALGLGQGQLDRLLAEAVLEYGIDIDAIERFIARSKPLVLDRSGLLTAAQAAPSDELGGLSGFKHWLHRRRLAFGPRARRAGIPEPRGVLLLGVQGCGKSLAARATAGILDLPLVRLDMGRLFGGTVGQSEANLRRATDVLGRIAPVVVWLDEIEKGVAGAEGAASDAGTSARVLGGLLTWLAERTRPVFVVATANRVDRVPPELLRRGRLDEVFFIDLPGPDEREQILQIHLELVPMKRLGAAPPTADPWSAFAGLVRHADGLSGAEIEGALTEARLDALAESRDLASADLERALAATVPLSVSRAEEIDALRVWAAGRARPAASATGFDGADDG